MLSRLNLRPAQRRNYSSRAEQGGHINSVKGLIGQLGGWGGVGVVMVSGRHGDRDGAKRVVVGGAPCEWDSPGPRRASAAPPAAAFLFSLAAEGGDTRLFISVLERRKRTSWWRRGRGLGSISSTSLGVFSFV